MASRPARLARLLGLARPILWLALGAALVVQLRVVADGGFRLPAFAQDYLARRLAAQGVDFHADAIWLDPQGRVLVIRPVLGLAGQDAPFAGARAVSLQLQRRYLLAGRIAPARVEVAGLSLGLPAIVSPTGAPQPLLTDGELRLSLDRDTGLWNVDQASARLLAIPAAFTGTLPAAGAKADRAPAPAAAVRSVLREAARAYRQIAALPLDRVRVARVDFSPEKLTLSAESDLLESPASPRLPPPLAGARLESVDLRLTLPFSATLNPALDDAELRLSAARFAAPALSLRGDALELRLSPGPVVDADIAIARAAKTDVPIPPLPIVASVRYDHAARALALDAAARLADSPWGASFSGSATELAGRATAAGALTPAMLELVRPFLPEKARPILEISDPVSIDAAVDLAPGARLARAEARAAFSGRARAGRVRFDRAGAVLVYEPSARRLRADELLLVQDDTHALGSYEMDTETLAYRFILAGAFRPASISNWFTGWWDDFWSAFHFGPLPPAAEVDIQGVWREHEKTTVYVGAASGPMRLRDLELDSLQTRVQVASGYFDIPGFRATRGPAAADGRISRVLGPDHHEWSALAFDVRSDFPADSLPKLFGEDGRAFVSAFSPGVAPRLRLSGESFGPASTRPGLQNYDLDLAIADPFRYAGFPLDRLSLRLARRDSDLRLRDIQAGVAAGAASGEARLTGPDAERKLAFDIELKNADLDLLQARWREFQAGRAPSPSATGPVHDPKEAKPLGGRITISFAGSGPLGRPLEFSGQGAAKITGADLAKIRLMGPLSSLLGEIGIGFTTVKLTEADARLALDRERLVFEELRLTGPSALVEAKGAYALADGALDFTAKLRPFEQRDGILGSTADLVLSPLSSALEIELGGKLEEPTWTFAYGPRKLFRKITDRF